MTSDELEKLRTEILSKDLEVYRTLETWGSSLFLGAIAVVAKEIVDWELPTDSARGVSFDPWVYGVPFAIGVVAFAFLRIVNFRGRRASKARETIIGQLPFARPSWGMLGALFAIMPPRSRCCGVDSPGVQRRRATWRLKRRVVDLDPAPSPGARRTYP